MRRSGLGVLALLAVAGCAETTASLPAPAEYLVVAAPGAGGLSITSLSQARVPFLLLIGPGMPLDARPIASREIVLIAYAGGDSLAVVDLVPRTVALRLDAGSGAGALGGVFADDSVAWIASLHGSKGTVGLVLP